MVLSTNNPEKEFDTLVSQYPTEPWIGKAVIDCLAVSVSKGEIDWNIALYCLKKEIKEQGE